MTEYRVVEYYFPFFNNNAYKLQRKVRFLWFKWWETIQEDYLHLNGYDWSKHYNCPIIEEAENEHKG